MNRKNTDLAKVKGMAKTFLMLEPQETKFSPIIVKHPFTDSGIVYFQDDGIKQVNIIEDNDGFRNWQNQMKLRIDEAESAYQVYFLITKPYSFAFLKYTFDYLSRDDFSEILADAWMRNEEPNNDPNLSKRKLLSMFKYAEPTVLMDESELEELNALDDVITVYRGVTSYNSKNIKALSWTLDYDTAEWFANRFGENGTVYQAQIDKEHIYALFNGRNESEMIVDPKFLTDIEEAQIQSSGMTLM